MLDDVYTLNNKVIRIKYNISVSIMNNHSHPFGIHPDQQGSNSSTGRISRIFGYNLTILSSFGQLFKPEGLPHSQTGGKYKWDSSSNYS